MNTLLPVLHVPVACRQWARAHVPTSHWRNASGTQDGTSVATQRRIFKTPPLLHAHATHRPTNAVPSAQVDRAKSTPSALGNRGPSEWLQMQNSAHAAGLVHQRRVSHARASSSKINNLRPAQPVPWQEPSYEPPRLTRSLAFAGVALGHRRAGAASTTAPARSAMPPCRRSARRSKAPTSRSSPS